MNHKQISTCNKLLASELGRDSITSKPLYQWTFSAETKSHHNLPSLLFKFKPDPGAAHIFGSGMEEIKSPGGLIVGLQVPIQTIWLGLHITPPRWIICKLQSDTNGLNPGGHYVPFEMGNGVLGLQIDQEPTNRSTQAIIHFFRRHERETPRIVEDKKSRREKWNWKRPTDNKGLPDLKIQAPYGSKERELEDRAANILTVRDPHRPGATPLIYNPLSKES